MQTLSLENFTNQQGLYNCILDHLEEKDLSALFGTSKKLRRVVRGYNLPITVEAVTGVVKDLLEKMARTLTADITSDRQVKKMVVVTNTATKKTLKSSPEAFLKELEKLPEPLSRTKFLRTAWHEIFDERQKYYYIQLNTILESMMRVGFELVINNHDNPNFDLTSALKERVIELSKEQKRIVNPVIEEAVLSIAHHMHLPRVDADVLRNLVQFELAKVEPKSGLDVHQTLEEFERIISETFENMEPIYAAYLAIHREIHQADVDSAINGEKLRFIAKAVGVYAVISIYVLGCIWLVEKFGY